MEASVQTLFADAEARGYALGGFNIYNLEGVLAVISAAEAARSPVILQVHSTALQYGGSPLLALCLAAARDAAIPAAVHLDHSASLEEVEFTLKHGGRSVMIDGSHLPFEENVTLTKRGVELAHSYGALVEAELGRLAGTEDGLTVDEYEAKLTDPEQAEVFIRETAVETLAVCIGNVHGPYHRPPQLEFDRLRSIRTRVQMPLVLHGASGLPPAMISEAIEGGVRKFNVNTEMRAAYLGALQQVFTATQRPDLLDVLRESQTAMRDVVHQKLVQFGSIGMA